MVPIKGIDPSTTLLASAAVIISRRVARNVDPAQSAPKSTLQSQEFVKVDDTVPKPFL